jgi:hypothetical protein
MKWNASDWWLGILTGELFGLYLALSLIDGIFQPSTDAKNWTGVSGLIGSLIVVQVRSWRFRRKNVPASTH